MSSRKLTLSRRYQDISDDSPPTLVSSMGSLFASLRPDRALSTTPVETPKERFKDQYVHLLSIPQTFPHRIQRPIEATTALLPFYEFLQLNQLFGSVFLETLSGASNESISTRPPLPIATLSLCSYILSHAGSTATARSVAYANLTLRTLLLLVEEEPIFRRLAREEGVVRLCRQVGSAPRSTCFLLIPLHLEATLSAPSEHTSVPTILSARLLCAMVTA